MVKTALTGINGVNQSLRHSKSEVKIARKQQAIKILSATGSNRRDSLSISDSARSFSKKSIAALIDSSGHIHVSADDTFTSTDIIYPSKPLKDE